jgi:hypothetical protein
VTPRWLLLACLLLAGCEGSERHDVDARRPRSHRRLGDADVAAAVRDLVDTLREEGIPPWPGHLPRSRDFPELPLVRVGEAEDLGRVRADVDGLTRALEREVRQQRLLRLSTDEEAVPPSLREEPLEPAPQGEPDIAPDPEPRRKPGLLLRAWTDEEGRLRLELKDLVTGKRLVRARSR